jgi:hypothetical protein
LETPERSRRNTFIHAGADFSQIDPASHNHPPPNLGLIIAVIVVISVGLLLLIFV